jgi:uncharacterized protein YjbJ (UPF0337 family)
MEKSSDTRIRGKANQIKGNIKKGLGRMNEDSALEAEGSADIIKGRGQGVLANVKDAVKGRSRNASRGAESAAGKLERASNKLRH